MAHRAEIWELKNVRQKFTVSIWELKSDELLPCVQENLRLNKYFELNWIEFKWQISELSETGDWNSVNGYDISRYYKLVQGFRVTCLFTGQYNTKGYFMSCHT